jgi:hypothetical protein
MKKKWMFIFAGLALTLRGEETNLRPLLKRASEQIDQLRTTYRQLVAPYLAERVRSARELKSQPNAPEPHLRSGWADAHISLASAELRAAEASVFDEIIGKLNLANEGCAGAPAALRDVRDTLRAQRGDEDVEVMAQELDAQILVIENKLQEIEMACAAKVGEQNKFQAQVGALEKKAGKLKEQANTLAEAARVIAQGALSWFDVFELKDINLEIGRLLEKASENQPQRATPNDNKKGNR